MTLRMVWALVVGTFVLAPGAARAQQPLVADRPDFTESASVVGSGVTQLEFGYTLTGEEGDARAHNLGETLVRIGLPGNRIELRVAASPVARSDHGVEFGVTDIFVGAKINLLDGSRAGVALIPGATLATGSAAFTEGETLPGLNVAYAWNPSEKVSLGANTVVARQRAQSLVAALALGDVATGYVEWFGFFESEAPAQHYANAGLARLITEDLQWDVRAGIGLTEASADFFVGAGLVVRLGG